jgi:hypothetical protein
MFMGETPKTTLALKGGHSELGGRGDLTLKLRIISLCEYPFYRQKENRLCRLNQVAQESG